MVKLLLVSLVSVFAFASGGGASTGVEIPDLTMTWVGIASLIIFVVGYYFVAMENQLY